MTPNTLRAAATRILELCGSTDGEGTCASCEHYAAELNRAADAYKLVPTALLMNVDKWGHVPGSPYTGGCNVYARDTNPPCSCGLDQLRKVLSDA